MNDPENFIQFDPRYPVVERILTLAPELKKHRKSIMAEIKRMIHAEKMSVYDRVKRYHSWSKPTGNLEHDAKQHDWFQEITALKIKTHEDLMKADDDAVFCPQKPIEDHPCDGVLNGVICGKPSCSHCIDEKGNRYLCRECYTAEGYGDEDDDWDEEDKIERVDEEDGC